MAGATIINIAVLHSAAVALTIPLCTALALIARARSLGTLHTRGRANRAVTPPTSHTAAARRRCPSVGACGRKRG
jgi:hypothetical protein